MFRLWVSRTNIKNTGESYKVGGQRGPRHSGTSLDRFSTRVPCFEVPMTMFVRIGVFAALALGVAVVLVLGHFNRGEDIATVPSRDDNVGMRVTHAFQIAELSAVGVAPALPGTAEEKAELLSAAFEAAPVGPIDPVLHAAVSARHRTSLLSMRSCPGNYWPDLVSYCDAHRAGSFSKKVQTISLDTASDVREITHLVDGKWNGDGFALKVDSARAQANVDPALPYQWDRYGIKSVSDGRMIFFIGAELYEALVSQRSISLSSTSFRGERRLDRERLH